MRHTPTQNFGEYPPGPKATNLELDLVCGVLAGLDGNVKLHWTKHCHEWDLRMNILSTRTYVKTQRPSTKAGFLNIKNSNKIKVSNRVTIFTILIG